MSEKLCKSRMVSDYRVEREETLWWELMGYSEEAAARAEDDEQAWI